MPRRCPSLEMGSELCGGRHKKTPERKPSEPSEDVGKSWASARRQGTISHKALFLAIGTPLRE